MVRLDIIDQNVPSLELCKKMGFEVYSSLVVLDIEADKRVPAPSLPPGLVLPAALAFRLEDSNSNWRSASPRRTWRATSRRRNDVSASRSSAR